MFRILFAAILGGVIFFAWNIISWVAFPWHEHSIKHFENEDYIAELLNVNTTESGIYIIPKIESNINTSLDILRNNILNSGQNTMHQTPVFISLMHGEGKNLKTSAVYALTSCILISLLIIILLFCTYELNYLSRVIFITMSGLIGALIGYIPNWLMWGFDGMYTFVNIMDTTIGWFLAGIVIAGLIGREPQFSYEQI